MGENTKIEWADATVNFWIGCTKVSAACDHCYAEAFAKRTGSARWGNGEPRHRTKGAVALAFKLERQAERAGRRLRVFTNSLSDIFDTEVPDGWRDTAFAVMALTPNLDWLVLTKRPQVARRYLSDGEAGRRIANASVDAKLPDDLVRIPSIPLRNVWLGTTVENQDMANLRVPLLLDTPAAKRFLSCEPLLGPVDLSGPLNVVPHLRTPVSAATLRPVGPTESGWIQSYRMSTGEPIPSRLDWIIAGGESGPKARPMHPDWARSLRDQCEAAGVPFLFKKWGEYLPVGQTLAGFGKVHGATAVKPGRMKLHYGGTPQQAPKHAFAEHGVEFTSAPDGRLTFRVGKKGAGRLLDGVQHDGVPG